MFFDSQFLKTMKQILLPRRNWTRQQNALICGILSSLIGFYLLKFVEKFLSGVLRGLYFTVTQMIISKDSIFNV